jgi:hypothetical protein
MRMPVTRAKFAAVMGRHATNNDLIRCNCPQFGMFGHWFCGWCQDCDKPRFVCRHEWRNPEDDCNSDA